MAVALGGGVEPSPPQDPSAIVQAGNRRDLSPEERAVVANSVKTDLIDPTSVLFKWATFEGTASASGMFYCGLFNAKNRMGGYVGFKPFNAKVTYDGSRIIAVTDIFIPTADMPALAAIIPRTCEIAGYRLDEVARQPAMPG